MSPSRTPRKAAALAPGTLVLPGAAQAFVRSSTAGSDRTPSVSRFAGNADLADSRPRLRRALFLCALLSGTAWGQRGAAIPTDLGWEQSGPSAPIAFAPFALAAGEGRIALAGQAALSASFNAWRLEVRSAGDGSLEWSDQFGAGPFVFSAQAVAIDGGVVYVAGIHQTDSVTFSARLEARDLDDGSLLWTSLLDLGGSRGTVRLAVQADRLALLANFGLFGFALASFDRADGALLWSRAVATTAVFTDRAFTASEDRLFVAGSESSFYPFVLPVSPIGALFAFDAGTGADAWSLAPGTTVDDLALRAERLFFPVGTTGWDLRAVDAATGAPLWSEVLPGGSAQRVAVGPAGLFAAGRLGGDLHLRAHEPASGALLWEGFGGLGTRTAARELLVTEGRLHVVASTMSHGLVVQTWRTRSGAFVRSRALGGSYERVSGTVDSGVLAVLGGTGPPFTSASEAFAPWRLTALRGR